MNRVIGFLFGNKNFVPTHIISDDYPVLPSWRGCEVYIVSITSKEVIVEAENCQQLDIDPKYLISLT